MEVVLSSLEELTAEEQLAFFGLAKLIIRADQEFSGEETLAMEQAIEELGSKLFRSRITAARTRFKTLNDTMKAAQAVRRVPAQALLYGRLERLASSDGLVTREEAILEKLKELWGLR